MTITQEEFDFLKKLDKEFKEKDEISLNNQWKKEILSKEGRESFLLDFNTNRYILEKYTFNNRYRTSTVLARYDTNPNGRHTNPDGVVLKGPHIHIYKEGYDDKFAYSPEMIGIKINETFDKNRTFELFLKFMNIEMPQLNRMILC